MAFRTPTRSCQSILMIDVSLNAQTPNLQQTHEHAIATNVIDECASDKTISALNNENRISSIVVDELQDVDASHASPTKFNHQSKLDLRHERSAIASQNTLNNIRMQNARGAVEELAVQSGSHDKQPTSETSKRQIGQPLRNSQLQSSSLAALRAKRMKRQSDFEMDQRMICPPSHQTPSEPKSKLSGEQPPSVPVPVHRIDASLGGSVSNDQTPASLNRIFTPSMGQTSRGSGSKRKVGAATPQNSSHNPKRRGAKNRFSEMVKATVGELPLSTRRSLQERPSELEVFNVPRSASPVDHAKAVSKTKKRRSTASQTRTTSKRTRKTKSRSGPGSAETSAQFTSSVNDQRSEAQSLSHRTQTSGSNVPLLVPKIDPNHREGKPAVTAQLNNKSIAHKPPDLTDPAPFETDREIRSDLHNQTGLTLSNDEISRLTPGFGLQYVLGVTDSTIPSSHHVSKEIQIIPSSYDSNDCHWATDNKENLMPQSITGRNIAEHVSDALDDLLSQKGKDQNDARSKMVFTSQRFEGEQTYRPTNPIDGRKVRTLTASQTMMPPPMNKVLTSPSPRDVRSNMDGVHELADQATSIPCIASAKPLVRSPEIVTNAQALVIEMPDTAVSSGTCDRDITKESNTVHMTRHSASREREVNRSGSHKQRPHIRGNNISFGDFAEFGAASCTRRQGQPTDQITIYEEPARTRDNLSNAPRPTIGLSRLTSQIHERHMSEHDRVHLEAGKNDDCLPSLEKSSNLINETFSEDVGKAILQRLAALEQIVLAKTRENLRTPGRPPKLLETDRYMEHTRAGRPRSRVRWTHSSPVKIATPVHYTLNDRGSSDLTPESMPGKVRDIGRWRFALHPHQMNLFDELVNASHRLVSGMISHEVAEVNAIGDFDRRARWMIECVNKEIIARYAEYMSSVNKKRTRLQSMYKVEHQRWASMPADRLKSIMNKLDGQVRAGEQFEHGVAKMIEELAA